jgi:hypothetical protein
MACLKVECQDLALSFKENAIKLEKNDSLNKSVYNLLSPYRLIMIGEIHGTNEPVNFLVELVKLLTYYGDSVQIGFEIPTMEMQPFLKQKNKINLLETDFFKYPTGDGRASEAWYNAISRISNMPKASLFFFDINSTEIGNVDSIMYHNVKSKIKERPNLKTITICGGIHNSLKMYDNQNTMGVLLYNDKELSINDSICSINHNFKGGQTLWNKFNEMETVYSKIEYDNYLYIYPKNSKEPYSGFLYTKFVTKSDSVIK